MAAKKQHVTYNIIQPYQENISGRYGDITKDSIYKNCWHTIDDGEVYLDKRPSINTSVLSTQGMPYGLAGTYNCTWGNHTVIGGSNSGIAYSIRDGMYYLPDSQTTGSNSAVYDFKLVIQTELPATSTAYTYVFSTKDFVRYSQITALDANCGWDGVCAGLKSGADSSTRLVAVGSNNIKTIDIGLAPEEGMGTGSWTSRTPASGTSVFHSVDTSGGIYVAVGNNGGSTGYIERSTDYGATWAAATITGSPSTFTSVRYCGGNKWVAMTADSPTGKTWYSSNSGANWAESATPVSSCGTSRGLVRVPKPELVAGGDGVVYFIGSAGVSKSTDYGDTWSTMTISPASPGWAGGSGASYFTRGAKFTVNSVTYLFVSDDEGYGYYATWSSGTTLTQVNFANSYACGYTYSMFYRAFIAVGRYTHVLYPYPGSAELQKHSVRDPGKTLLDYAGSSTDYKYGFRKNYNYILRDKVLYKYDSDFSLSLAATSTSVPIISESTRTFGKISVATLRQGSGISVDYIVVPGRASASTSGLSAGNILCTIAGGWDFNYVTYNTPTTTFNYNTTYVVARGVATMDGYAFFLMTTGELFNTELQEPTHIPASNYTLANRYPDIKMYLTKHAQHIVVIGTQGIEFFYNAGNPLGSPLSRRNDIMYPVGCAARNTACTLHDVTIFVGGTTDSANLGVYMLAGTKLEKISVPALESYLQINVSQTWDLVTLNSHMFAEFIEAHDHTIYILTVINSSNNAVTFVYDLNAKRWYQWYIQDRDGRLDTSGGKTGLEWVNTATNDMLDIIGWSRTDNTNVPYVQLSTGEIYKWPKNTYSSDLGSTAIEMIIQTENNAYGTQLRKHFNAMYFNCAKVGTSNNISIQYSDDDGVTWSTARTVNLNSYYPVATRWGQARRRQWKFTHTDGYAVRLQAIELEVEGVGNEFQPKRRVSTSE